MADDPDFAVFKIANVLTEDSDVSQSYDAAEVDSHVNRCILSAIRAIETGSLEGFSPFELSQVRNVIAGVRHSHKAIRQLLRGEQSASAVDAQAIAQIQLESVFTTCYLLASPENVRLFLKSAWKKKYIRFLLDRTERAHLERFRDYYSRTGADLIEKLRLASSVTSQERLTIDSQQLGAPSVPKSEQAHISGFPTPAKVAKKLNNQGQKQMLSRLNAEYEYLCSFAHGDSEAIFFKTIADPHSPYQNLQTSSEVTKVYQEQILELPVIYSGFSSILVATEVAAAFPNDIELRATLSAAWDFITQISPMTTFAWERRAKRVLGILDKPGPAKGESAVEPTIL